MRALLRTGLVAIAVALPTAAQSSRPLAIVDARILTLAGAPIEHGTIVIVDGRIDAVGKRVKVPPGAERIDARGGTVMPGLVSAFSRAGVAGPSGSRTTRRVIRRYHRSGPTRSTKPTNAAAQKLAESLYARQDVFAELLDAGVTTLALAPAGTGFPGLAATVDPGVGFENGFVADDDAYLVIGMATQTSTKQMLEKSLEAAAKRLEERNKPKAPESKPTAEAAASKPTETEKAAESQPQSKPSEAGTEKAEAPKPAKEKKPDPNVEVLADLLDGKRRAFVEAGSANDLAHYRAAIDEHRFPTTVVVPGHNSWAGLVHEAADTLVELGASVLVVPMLASPVYSAELVDPAAALRAAGVEVGFLVGDSQAEVRNLFFRLLELVRCGWTPDDVLRAVTLTPATMLGLEDEIGTIEKGKRADLLLFDGDPLAPTSRLVEVFRCGRAVRGEATR